MLGHEMTLRSSWAYLSRIMTFGCKRGPIRFCDDVFEVEVSSKSFSTMSISSSTDTWISSQRSYTGLIILKHTNAWYTCEEMTLLLSRRDYPELDLCMGTREWNDIAWRHNSEKSSINVP